MEPKTWKTESEDEEEKGLRAESMAFPSSAFHDADVAATRFLLISLDFIWGREKRRALGYVKLMMVGSAW